MGQAWSSKPHAQLLAQGRPGLAHFTAAWCVTWRHNQKITLARNDELADYAAKNRALLRAD